MQFGNYEKKMITAYAMSMNFIIENVDKPRGLFLYCGIKVNIEMMFKH